MDSDKWGAWWREPSVAFLGVSVLLAAPKLVPLWWSDPIFSAGFLLAPWAFWWVLSRRPSAADFTPQPIRVWILAGAVGLAAYGWFASSTVHALWGMGAALALVAAERDALRRCIVPLALLAVTAPPPAFDLMLVRAQMVVATASAWEMELIGQPVRRDLWYLHTPSYTFIVAPVCSGFSGLQATWGLIGIVGTHASASLGRIAAAFGLGAVLSVVFNIQRVAVLVMGTERFGPSVVEGVLHDGVSILVSLIVFAIVVPFVWRGRRADEPGVLGGRADTDR